MADGTVPAAEARRAGERTATRRRFRLPIATALALAFGALVFAGVASVLGVGMWSARQNTAVLLGDKSDLSIDVLVANLRRHLDPVALANDRLAELIGRGEVDTGDLVELTDHMRGAMAATPQVVGMAFIDMKQQVVRISRANPRVGIRLSDWSNNPQVAGTLAKAREKQGSYWGELFRSQESQTTLLNRRAPLWRNGRFLGILVSAVSVAELSRLLADDEEDETLTRFILYGRDHVLAHFAMIGDGPPQDKTPPLPRLDQVGDPVLARLWDPAVRSGRLPLALTGATQGHRAEIDGHSYLVLYRTLTGYAQLPLYVGAYTRLDEGWLANEIDRLLVAATVGLAILIASVAAALYLGRRMTRSIRALASAAEKLSALDLADPPRLAESRLVELDRATRAFNAMVTGLRWFETYVPRTVVRQLLAAGGQPAVVSEERPVTVLFTDIRGFTALAQSMSAAETASFLNQHFSLIAACVEAEDGTVDKYMGDSMMAFWGAPRADPDHVERACRAALAIRRAVTLDNERRAQRNEPPIRMGIGIHTGSAIVGNIGAPGRINYTLVGDTVNVAQRLEELSKDVAAPETVEILISRAVAARLGEGYGIKEHGVQRARGREGMLEVLRLV